MATFKRTLSSNVPSMVARVAVGRAEAEQQSLSKGKVETVLAAEPHRPPEPACSPPEDAPARCIDTREEARRVVEVLLRHSKPDRVHAVDTEVMGLDLKKSPHGPGRQKSSRQMTVMSKHTLHLS